MTHHEAIVEVLAEIARHRGRWFLHGRAIRRLPAKSPLNNPVCPVSSLEDAHSSAYLGVADRRGIPYLTADMLACAADGDLGRFPNIDLIFLREQMLKEAGLEDPGAT